jgi:hypothetical protein
MKKPKKKRDAPGSNKGRKNPKAFNVANVVRTKRTQQRNLDRAQKKELVPLVDRSEVIPPPSLIVVMVSSSCAVALENHCIHLMFPTRNLFPHGTPGAQGSRKDHSNTLTRENVHWAKHDGH